ncbi:hypothetical protein CYMTET_51099, partial [Cymbomonas tetramitiformis]
AHGDGSRSPPPKRDDAVDKTLGCTSYEEYLARYERLRRSEEAPGRSRRGHPESVATDIRRPARSGERSARLDNEYWRDDSQGYSRDMPAGSGKRSRYTH